MRGGEIAMIFQEPMSALNPVLTVGAQIRENLEEHTELDAAARQARAIELLDLVGIPAAKARIDDYPHQFSGGMRQRAMIAIALASESAAAAGGRAHHRARRHDPGPDPEADPAPAPRSQHERRAGDPRSRRDRADLRPAGGHVCGPRGGSRGRSPEIFAEPRHAYTLGLLNSVPRGGALAPALEFHRRPAAAPCRSSRSVAPSRRAVLSLCLNAMRPSRHWSESRRCTNPPACGIARWRGR